MRKIFTLMLLLVAASAHAQNSAPFVCDTYGLEKTLSANTVDTVYFALPPEYGWVGYVKFDTTSGYNITTKILAQRFRWNGNAKLSIDLISGNTADSMRIAVISITKYVVSGVDKDVLGDANSITYLAGTASTFSSVVGNGSSNAFTITQNVDPSPAIGIIITVGDLVGGARRFRIQFTPQ